MFSSITDFLGDVATDVLDVFGKDSRFGRAGLVLFLGLGVLAGGASLWLLPAPLIESFELSLLAGLVAPILVGMLVAGFGGVKLLDWQFKFNLERFGAAFCVTLALGVTRFAWFMLQVFS
ncbi:hypothetical protein [Pyxidicoccus sp. MSG2]|uniref:hypothetical protein n=1 Tax=Pyxidicoccus sp. MSG2 TaxID=2996790 RepID=UPI00226E13F6|nr:hypothetical protein [Pyxidicoccus sp. MSG2]MCY1018120.1 hypothetical protein [Pyxidicoccus sp. MSG2]